MEFSLQAELHGRDARATVAVEVRIKTPILRLSERARPGKNRRDAAGNELARYIASAGAEQEWNTGSDAQNAAELPAADEPVGRARAAREPLAPSERELINHREG